MANSVPLDRGSAGCRSPSLRPCSRRAGHRLVLSDVVLFGPPHQYVFKTLADHEAEAYRQRCANAARFVSSFAPSSPRLSRGAQSSAHSLSNAHMNVWVASLCRSGVLAPAGSLTQTAHTKHAGIVRAFIFGLPVWTALDILPPRPEHCKHCGAAAALPAKSSAHQSRSRGSISVPAPHDRPPHGEAAVHAPVKKSFDPHGLHLQMCPRSGIFAGPKFKHDSIARQLAVISAACGREGEYHDRKLFLNGSQQRPADLIQKARNHFRFPEGEAIDFTYGLEFLRHGSAAQRESAKLHDYEPQMRLHPHLQFSPFGVTHDGDVGPSAQRLIADWTAALATRASNLLFPILDCRTAKYMQLSHDPSPALPLLSS